MNDAMITLSGETSETKSLPRMLFQGTLLLVLVLLSFKSYLLFHTLAELFSIVIAFTFFIVTWNGRRFFDNHFLLLLGIAFLFIGFIDLIHALGYKGMQIFQRQDSNLAPQLWIGARYLEALSFLAAFFFIRRKVAINWMMTVYGVITGLLLLSIFEWEIFPDCWVEGAGLTTFKKNSEYLICLLLLIGIALLQRYRDRFEKKIQVFLHLAMFTSMGAELSFTFYVDMYGLSNLAGHIFKILSFYFLYKAVVESTLETPFKTLYHNITQARDALTIANQELKTKQKQLEMAQEIAHLGHWHWDIVNDRLTWSKEIFRIFGLDPAQEQPSYAVFLDAIPREERTHVILAVNEALNDPEVHYHTEHPVRRPDGSLRFVLERGEVIRQDGQPVAMLGTFLDLTEQKRVEYELQQSKQFLQLVLDSIPSRVFWKDRDSVYLGCNQLFAQDAGFASAQEVVGQRDQDMGWQGHASQYVEQDQMVMASGQAKLHYENLRTTPYHEPLWLRTSKVPLRDEKGKVIGILGTYEDISESRKALQQLASNEARLRHAFDAIDEGIWDWSITSDQVHCSARWYQLFGFADGEVPNVMQGWRERLHPEEAERVHQALQDHLQGKTPAYSSEHRIRHRDGHWLWIMERGKVIEWDAENHPIRMIGAGLDLTRRHDNEEKIRILSQAVEQSPSSIAITDPRGMIQYVNPTFLTTTGYSQAEVLGQNPRIIKSGLTTKAVYQDLWRTISSGKVWRGEISNRRKNGAIFWELANISPIRSPEGLITHYLSIKDDITDKKRLEEERQQALAKAERANRAKSEFLANMSHEIRTPLNAIINLSYLLLQTPLTAKQASYLAKVESAGRSLLGVINDILDFSKIEAGHLALEEVSFNLEEVMGNVTSIASARMEGKPLELLYHLAPGVPQFLTGDPLRLGQVLINLTNNAIKFTEAGEVVIRVEQVDGSTDPVQLRFSVRDTGIGITPEQQRRLFSSFSQADGSISRRYGGTGLGLAISKRLVELMGGVIQMASIPGQGSTFAFIIPLRPSQETAVIPDATSLARVRAMVVDDNPTAREILKSQLESFQMVVSCAASGQEALDLLANAPPEEAMELLLLDYRMPGIDGLETARRLRSLNHLVRQPQVLLVTAHGREELQREAEELGIQGFLLKPVSPMVLLEIILEIRGEALPRKVHSGQGRLDREQEAGLALIRGARVLLVEDNAINQEIAMALLSHAGVQVIVASSGKEALAILAREDPFDLVLMDIQMSDMDGFETTRRIRADEHFRNLPVVAMTAHAMVGDRENSLNAGMQDHIPKPIDPAQLFAALIQWIQPREGDFSQPMAGAGDLEDEEMAGLPGIDTWMGLGRVGGNRTLYYKLLRRFGKERQGLVAELTQQVAVGDWEGARRLVHTIKGLAGSLGMMELHKAGQVLEMAVATGQQEVFATALPSVDLALARVLAGLTRLPEEKKSVQGGEIQIEQAIPLVRGMLIVLEEDFGAVQERLEQLRPLLQEGLAARHFHQLAAALDEFDTDHSRQLLHKLLEMLQGQAS